MSIHSAAGRPGRLERRSRTNCRQETLDRTGASHDRCDATVVPPRNELLRAPTGPVHEVRCLLLALKTFPRLSKDGVPVRSGPHLLIQDAHPARHHQPHRPTLCPERPLPPSPQWNLRACGIHEKGRRLEAQCHGALDRPPSAHLYYPPVVLVATRRVRTVTRCDPFLPNSSSLIQKPRLERR